MPVTSSSSFGKALVHRAIASLYRWRISRIHRLLLALQAMCGDSHLTPARMRLIAYEFESLAIRRALLAFHLAPGDALAGAMCAPQSTLYSKKRAHR